jgi:predicted acyl esterase
VPIQSYLAGLLAAGQPMGNGYYAPPGVDPTADIVTAAARVLAGNPFVREDPVVASNLEQFSRFKSASGIPMTASSTRVQLFWVQGLTDPLFTAHEALQTYNRLRTLDARWPVKLFFGDFGHDYAAERVDEWDAAHASMNAFVDHYLRPARTRRAPAFDVTSAVTRCLAPDAPMRLLRASRWARLHPYSVRLSAGASPVVSNSAVVTSVGMATDPVSGASLPTPGAYKGCRKLSPAATDGNAATYSWVLPRGLLLAGGPVLDVVFGTTGPDTELNVRVWDVAPGGSVQGLVSRGTYRSLDGPAAGGLRARFQLAPQAYRFEPGHSLKVEITANDFPYHQTSNVPALLTVERVDVDLPLAERA